MHYTGTTETGLIRGGHHLAHPSELAATQVDHFVKHDGGWTADGRTLPGMLELEAGLVSQCWGLNPHHHGRLDPRLQRWVQGRYRTRPYPPYQSVLVEDVHRLLARLRPEEPPHGRPLCQCCRPRLWRLALRNNLGMSDDYKFGDSDVFNGDEAALKRLPSGWFLCMYWVTLVSST